MKALTILLYYDRPNMVRNALRSWQTAAKNHPDSILVVNDDASPHPVKPIVDEVLGDDSRVFVIRSSMTSEDKAKSGGLLGLDMNGVVATTDADFAVMLCDDDMLAEDSLANIDKFFSDNPEVMSCYGNVLRYDPSAYTGLGVPLDASMEGFPVPLNSHVDPINPSCRLDASQVAWRIDCHRLRGCWFDYPRTKDIDAVFFNELFHRCGPCHYTGTVFQYKGVHDRQLGVVGVDKAWAEGGLDTPSSPIEVTDECVKARARFLSGDWHSEIKPYKPSPLMNPSVLATCIMVIAFFLVLLPLFLWAVAVWFKP